jgi:phosphoglycerate dehydrogenase-like enzyme
MRGWLRRLLEPTGCVPADDPAQADGLVWIDAHDPQGLADVLARAPKVRWVQLPSAGVERWVKAGILRGPDQGPDRVWTAAKGVYGDPVAEHALALLLAGLRHLDERVGATSWGGLAGRTLFGANVVVLGAGGIAQSLLRLLEPFRVQATLVRRQADPLARRAGDGDRPAVGDAAGGMADPAADAAAATTEPRTVGRDRLHDVLPEADAVILALALTPETAGIIAEPELRLMKDDAWLVNVARGGHVVTDDLVRALHGGWIGGAALDVTDPEPLPDGHPLWGAPRCIITPHSASPDWMAGPLLMARIADNASRFAEGRPLLGLVDLDNGY